MTLNHFLFYFTLTNDVVIPAKYNFKCVLLKDGFSETSETDSNVFERMLSSINYCIPNSTWGVLGGKKTWGVLGKNPRSPV